MKSGKQFLKEVKPGTILCGLDEVGRGCWAGPLFACALILKKDFRHAWLRDSKQLTASQREEMYLIIEQKAWWGIGRAEVEEIDSLGLIKANNLAFQRALDQLIKAREGHKSDHLLYLLIDGRDTLSFPFPFTTIIKGDQKVKEIACASIMAKVTRDRHMVEIAAKYPDYGFDQHKGYGTSQHQKALRAYGITPLHRRSFKPVQTYVRHTSV